MIWRQRSKLKEAILNRLGHILQTDRPAEALKEVTRMTSLEYPEVDLESDYSVIEDLAVQKIILIFQDHQLDRMWLRYNAGYFSEATRESSTLKKSHFGEET